MNDFRPEYEPWAFEPPDLIGAKETADLVQENKTLRTALRDLLACCEKHPAFQKPGNRITAGRVAAARAALGL
jgi:hypothetical protein